MVRARNKLNAAQVKAANKTGRKSDGGGLYLNTSTTGTKSWVFVWTRNERKREMGLGSALDVSLHDARRKAENCRCQVNQGLDPIVERDKATEPTFIECVDLYLEAHQSKWKNEKHIYQWNKSLRDYAKPIHSLRVSQVSTSDVLRILKPIWLTKHETASRTRSRIEAVLDYACAMNWRTGLNPATWRGNLKSLLPTISKSKRVKHYASMPMDNVPRFMKELRSREAIAARLVEFVVLTACRSIEAREMTWEEVDLDNKIWTIPKDRMKAGVAHIVPLSSRAYELLTELNEFRISPLVFPHPDSRKPLSVNAPRALLKRMNLDITLHGFRASFKSWATDRTNFQREVIEMSLAHKVGNQVEQSYLRTTAIEKRRSLMQAWADYGEGKNPTNVIWFERSNVG